MDTSQCECVQKYTIQSCTGKIRKRWYKLNGLTSTAHDSTSSMVHIFGRLIQKWMFIHNNNKNVQSL